MFAPPGILPECQLGCGPVSDTRLESLVRRCSFMEVNGFHGCGQQVQIKPSAPSIVTCLFRAYEIEKGFVRETPLTYVVALSGNTAKDVTQR